MKKTFSLVTGYISGFPEKILSKCIFEGIFEGLNRVTESRESYQGIFLEEYFEGQLKISEEKS